MLRRPVRYSLGARTAPLRNWSGSCHWNLNGKHSAADLSGRERKYDLGPARLLGRLGHGRGRERILHSPQLDYAHDLESGLRVN